MSDSPSGASRPAGGRSSGPSGGDAPANSGVRVLQARAVRTRESVLNAAAEVFERHGYGAASVEDIAREAQATKGSVYFHFPSKAALAVAVVHQQHAVWAELARASQDWDLNGLDTIERIIREVARTYATNPLMRAGVRLANERDQIEADIDVPFVGWVQRLTRLLRRGQSDGSVDPQLQCAATARAIVASFYGIEEVSARLNGRRDLNRRVREWWQLLRPGLANPTPPASDPRERIGETTAAVTQGAGTDQQPG